MIAALDPPPETRDALIAAIAEQREAERRAHHDLDVGGLAAELRALADSVEAWDVEAAGATPLIAALRRTYRSARRRGEAALPSGAPRELHGLRVRVVDLVYQLGVFEPAWPAMMRATMRELQRLRTALGDHNDLTVLAEFAAARPELTPEQKVAVAVLIAKRRRPLARRAAQLYARLFAERPSAFERRLAANIENPRRKPPAHRAAARPPPRRNGGCASGRPRRRDGSHPVDDALVLAPAIEGAPGRSEHDAARGATSARRQRRGRRDRRSRRLSEAKNSQTRTRPHRRQPSFPTGQPARTKQEHLVKHLSSIRPGFVTPRRAFAAQG